MGRFRIKTEGDRATSRDLTRRWWRLVSTGIEAAALMHKVGERVYMRTRNKREVDERRARFYESLWLDAAREGGWSVTTLAPGLIEIKRRGRALRVRQNLTSLDDSLTEALAGDKPAVLTLLSSRGLPVPRHLVCDAGDWSKAWRFVRTSSTGCVVKPARGGAGGVGVTTGVLTRARLARALAKAGSYCPDVMIEDQALGHVYRLLFLDGQLLDVVLRNPTTVMGDGRSTVRQLIDAENQYRKCGGIQASQALVTIDAEMKNTLASQGYRLRSVPPAGSVVRLKNVVNDNRSDENIAVPDAACPDIVQAAAAAAAAVGARLSGVDVMTADPGVALETVGGVILEVNTTPGFYYHYHRVGERLPLASVILERLVNGER
jgi:D-alanine-D-alanine ligase-like ATP-grasp enzyme